jgi:hypothetical protein
VVAAGHGLLGHGLGLAQVAFDLFGAQHVSGVASLGAPQCA